MINIAIVDDDKYMLDKISDIITAAIDIEISIEKYEKSITFYESENKTEFDIIFLDIDMPGINGFELAEALEMLKKENIIVFVSNLEHLVYESLKFRPFRFVRKSHLNKDVNSAITDYLKERKKKEDVFLVKTNSASMNIPVSDIIYFESLGHNIYVNTIEKGKILMLRERNSNTSIQSLYEKFVDKGFIRAHRSYLVNYKFIYVVKHSEIILKNNETIYINPHKSLHIKERYQYFIMKDGI